MASTYTDDIDRAFVSMNRERKTKLVLVIGAIFAVAIAGLMFAELSSPYFIQLLR
jgi:hypothetical protein